MIDARISLFAIVMLSGVLADMLMERELTLPRKLFMVGQWALISLAAAWITPVDVTGYGATLAAVIGGGRVVAWSLRALVEWLGVVVATRRVLRRFSFDLVDEK